MFTLSRPGDVESRVVFRVGMFLGGDIKNNTLPRLLALAVHLLTGRGLHLFLRLRLFCDGSI
jgi:hypothetical protein